MIFKFEFSGSARGENSDAYRQVYKGRQGKAGDVCEVEIEGLGVLRNDVVDEA